MGFLLGSDAAAGDGGAVTAAEEQDCRSRALAQAEARRLLVVAAAVPDLRRPQRRAVLPEVRSPTEPACRHGDR
jgi:hypothetical protein